MRSSRARHDRPRWPGAFLLRPLATLSALSLLGCCFGSFGNVAAVDAGPRPVDPSTLPPPPPPPEVARTLVAIDVVLPLTKPNGDAWDVAGGAPDPFVVVRQAGHTLFTTERVQDSSAGYWEVVVPFDRTQPLQIDVLDRDVAADDPVGSAVFDFADDSTSDDAMLTTHGGSLQLQVR